MGDGRKLPDERVEAAVGKRHRCAIHDKAGAPGKSEGRAAGPFERQGEGIRIKIEAECLNAGAEAGEGSGGICITSSLPHQSRPATAAGMNAELDIRARPFRHSLKRGAGRQGGKTGT